MVCFVHTIVNGHVIHVIWYSRGASCHSRWPNMVRIPIRNETVSFSLYDRQEYNCQTLPKEAHYVMHYHVAIHQHIKCMSCISMPGNLNAVMAKKDIEIGLEIGVMLYLCTSLPSSNHSSLSRLWGGLSMFNVYFIMHGIQFTFSVSIHQCIFIILNFDHHDSIH